MAFKMKGFQAHSNSPMKKGPITWIKSKAKQAKDYIADKTVNMSNIGGMSKSDKKIFDAGNTSMDQFYADSKKRRKADAAADKAKQAYKDSYMTDKIGQQRDNESDAQYKRRMDDVTKHKQAYADKRYAEDQAKKSKTMTPKTKDQSTKTKKKNFVAVDKKEKSNKA